MDTNSKLSNNTGVILVSHGSTLPYAKEVFTEIKEKFKGLGLALDMQLSDRLIAALDAEEANLRAESEENK